jgi:hypothetical protein
VLSFFSSRRIWDSPNPSPAGECAPPPFWGEGQTRWLERGWESPNSDEGTHTVVLFLCNCGGHNAPNKSMLIFKCPCIVVWFGNLAPPFILPPPFRILNGGGRLNGGARFPNQTNPTYLNKKNEYVNKKNEYLDKKNEYLNKKTNI